MLTSVCGSLRIELSVAFSMAGARTCPSRASLVAWAIAVGSTRPTAVGEALGILHHAAQSRQHLDLSAEQQGA